MDNMLLLAVYDFAFFKAVLLCAVALGLVIFIHELGHFLVAKACGVRCDKFYIGFDFFGLKLLKFKWGETEYGIGVFPLGGYVKMLGQEDNPGETRDRIAKAKAARELLAQNANAQVDKTVLMTDEEIADAEKLINDPRSYQAKSVPQRMAIIVAGVAMNVVMAFIAAVWAYALGVYKLPCELGNVHPGQAAWEAGLQADDKLEKIGTNSVVYFDDIPKNVALGNNLENGLDVVYHRDGMPMNASQATKAYPKKYAISPMLGASCATTPVLANTSFPVTAASPTFATERELKAGDVLVGINDRDIYSNLDYQKAMYATTGENVTMKFVRPSEDAKKKRNDALKKLTLDDDAKREAIEKEYRQGTETFEIMVAPLHARHFGVVMSMGAVQSIRTGVNGLEGAGRAGIKAGDKIVGLEVVTGEKTTMLRELDPVTLPWLVQREAKRAVVNAEAGMVPVVNFAILKAETKQEEVVPIEVSLDVFSADSYSFGCGEVLPEVGLTYEILPVVASVMPGSQAEKQGVKPGFTLKSVNLAFEAPEEAELSEKSKKIASQFKKDAELIFREGIPAWSILYHNFMLLYPLKHTQATVIFENPETNKSMTAKLALQEYADVFSYHSDLNFEPKQVFIQESFVSSIAFGATETWNSLTAVYRMLDKLFCGQVSVKGLGGPVLIAQVAYSAAREGLSQLLMFICLISANLAVLNLLPIPVLDGGHVVFLLWEGITGKAPNENLLVVLSYMGLILFLALTIFVFGLDLGFIPRF